MELEFDVKVTPSAMYDYLLHHTYSGMSGIIGTVFGVFFDYGFSCHEISDLSDCRYRSDWLSAGSPLLKAHQQVSMTPAFKQPLHYHMTDEGISVSQGRE